MDMPADGGSVRDDAAPPSTESASNECPQRPRRVGYVHGVWGFAAAGDWLYFNDSGHPDPHLNGAYFRMPKAGGESQFLGKVINYSNRIAVTDDCVYTFGEIDNEHLRFVN